MAQTPRVIAVVGMVREGRIIAGDGVKVVIGGGNAARLEHKLGTVLTALGYGVSDLLLLSFGVCGALDPTLKAGDLVVGSNVVSGGRSWATDRAWAEGLTTRLGGARLAQITAGDAMIESVAAKRALFDRTGAAVVDMESHIVAEAAARYALPFAVVRAVSDAADHTLPPAALAGLRPDGTPNIGAVLLSLARRPSQLPTLIKTARDAEAGFRALAAAAAALRA